MMNATQGSSLYAHNSRNKQTTARIQQTVQLKFPETVTIYIWLRITLKIYKGPRAPSKLRNDNDADATKHVRVHPRPLEVLISIILGLS